MNLQLLFKQLQLKKNNKKGIMLIELLISIAMFSSIFLVCISLDLARINKNYRNDIYYKNINVVDSIGKYFQSSIDYEDINNLYGDIYYINNIDKFSIYNFSFEALENEVKTIENYVQVEIEKDTLNDLIILNIKNISSQKDLDFEIKVYKGIYEKKRI